MDRHRPRRRDGHVTPRAGAAGAAPTNPVAWIDDDVALASVVDDGHRRAAVRHRHRVPPRAHVLPTPGAGAARLAGRRPALVDPLAVGTSELARAVRSRRGRRAPRRPAGPRRARPRRRGDPPAHLRHPDRGELRRLLDPVARGAGAGRARRDAGQGRPAHRLAAPAAERRPRRTTPPPTCATSSRCRTASTPSWPSSAAPTWVADACEELRTPTDRGDRPRGCLDPAEGRPHAAATLARRRPVAGGVARTGGAGARHAGAPGAPRPRRARHRPAPADDARRAGQCRGVDDRHRQGRVAREVLGGRAARPARRRRRRSRAAATTSSAPCVRRSR